MINAIIVEDEEGPAKVLKSLLEEYTPDVKIIGHAETVKDGVKLINSARPDLVFLDIRLPDGDGFEVLDKCSDLSFEVIFTTAYGEYREKAFDYFALHYLTKPIDIDKLEAAVNALKGRKENNFNGEKLHLIKALFNNDCRKIALPSKDGYALVEIKDIMRCEAKSNYTEIFLVDGKKYLVTKNLKYYDDLFSEFSFYRIHKSHLVNTKYVSEVNREGYVKMQDKTLLNISQRAKSEFLRYLERLS